VNCFRSLCGYIAVFGFFHNCQYVNFSDLPALQFAACNVNSGSRSFALQSAVRRASVGFFCATICGVRG
jgi:hypothetical protein